MGGVGYLGGDLVMSRIVLSGLMFVNDVVYLSVTVLLWNLFRDDFVSRFR